ncbi:MAG: hypothetical protein VXZ82_23475 [Planctomycetota bacterium]|nr:hypothetical protein [Planctomycetota bacterium]
MTEEAYVPPEDSPGESLTDEVTPGWLVPAVLGLSIVICMLGQFLIIRLADPTPDGSHVFYPPMHDQLGDPPEYITAKFYAMIQNNAVGFAVLGTVLMALVGAVIGVAKENTVKGLAAGLVGGLILGAAGGALGYVVEGNLAQFAVDGLVKTFAIWLPVAVSLALVPGIIAVVCGLTKSIPNAVITSVIGGALGTAAYVLLAATMFIGETAMLCPFDFGIRFLAFTGLGISTGSGVCLLVFLDKSSNKPAAAEVEAA